MRDEDELLNTPGLEFGSGVVGVCDICHKRQAVIILQKERYKLCVIDFLNKTFINSRETPGRPLPPYLSERVRFDTEVVGSGSAPAIVLSPTKVVKHPVVLITPDTFGITTTLLDAAIRFAKEGYEVMLPDVGKTDSVGPSDHVSLRTGSLLGGGVRVDSTRVRRMVALYRDALRFLRSREMVDPARTAFFGASYGGSLALALAGEERQVAAIALAYPMAIRPADYLKLVTARVLVVTGDRDRKSAPARQQLQRALEAREIAVEMFHVPGANHHFLARDLGAYDLQAAEATWARVIGFLRSNLNPPPPKPPTPPKPVAAATAPPAASVPPAPPATPAAVPAAAATSP